MFHVLLSSSLFPGHVCRGRWTVPWCTMRGPSDSLENTCSSCGENYESTLCQGQCTKPDGIRAHGNPEPATRGTAFEFAYQAKGDAFRIFFFIASRLQTRGMLRIAASSASESLNSKGGHLPSCGSLKESENVP